SPRDHTPVTLRIGGVAGLRRKCAFSLVRPGKLTGKRTIGTLPRRSLFRRGEGAKPMAMKVWIDQDLCTGDGLCEEIAPDVFTLLDDGLAYVKEGSKVFNAPGGADGLANIPEGQLDAV